MCEKDQGIEFVWRMRRSVGKNFDSQAHSSPGLQGSLVKGLVFHLFDRLLKQGYALLLSSVRTDDISFDVLAEQTTAAVMKKFWRSIFILLFFRFLVPFPGEFGSKPFLDSTFWVGFLSFEGAASLGYMALMPYIVRINLNGIVAVLVGGLRLGLLSIKDEFGEMSVGDFEKQAKNEINEETVSKSMARPVLHAGVLLFGIILIMLAGIWIPLQWKTAVLFVSLYWLGSVLSLLMASGVLAYNDLVVSAYKGILGEHEEIREGCPWCKTPQVVEAKKKKMSDVKKSFLWVAWLVFIVLFTYWDHLGKTYAPSLLTWVLLLIPMFYPILKEFGRFLYRRLRHRFFVKS